MEEVWVRFAREYPIGADESMAEYLRRFYAWSATGRESMERMWQLEQVLKQAYGLLRGRKLLMVDGRPTEFATREERDVLHNIGRAACGGANDRLDKVEVSEEDTGAD